MTCRISRTLSINYKGHSHQRIARIAYKPRDERWGVTEYSISDCCDTDEGECKDVRGDISAGLPFDSGSIPGDDSRTLLCLFLLIVSFYLLTSSIRPNFSCFV